MNIQNKTNHLMIFLLIAVVFMGYFTFLKSINNSGPIPNQNSNPNPIQQITKKDNFIEEPISFIIGYCDQGALLPTGSRGEYYKQDGKYYTKNGPTEITEQQYVYAYTNPPTKQSCQALYEKQRSDFVYECMHRGPLPAGTLLAPGITWFRGTQAQCEQDWINEEKYPL